MKTALCVFAIVLSFAIYPIVMLQNSELLYIFNFIETDFFNWYRMILVGLASVYIFHCRWSWSYLFFVILLLLSVLASSYPETSVYGTPMHHEGLIAIVGYLGIYHAAKHYGFFKGLERSLDAVIFITAFIGALQLWYGNFLNFPVFKWLISDIQMTAIKWPLYANMGGPNNLGLFCALFIPYAILRKKWVQLLLLSALLIGSQSRGAWLSVIVTTTIISRKYLLYAFIGLAILAVPMRETITSRIIQSVDHIHWPIRDGDLSGRAYMWKRAIPVLKDSIILGKGPATYLHFVPQFHERGNAIGFQMQAIDRPHNMFINIWQSTGLLSLLVLAFALYKILKAGKDASLKMGVIGYLIAGIFTDSVLCVTPYFLIFLGGLSSEHRETRRSA